MVVALMEAAVKPLDIDSCSAEMYGEVACSGCHAIPRNFLRKTDHEPLLAMTRSPTRGLSPVQLWLSSMQGHLRHMTRAQILFTPNDFGFSNHPQDKHYINFWLKEQGTQVRCFSIFVPRASCY